MTAEVNEVKKSPTANSFKTYKKALKPDIEKALTDIDVAHTGYHDAVRSQDAKSKLFKKAEAALAEYEGLLNGIVVAAHQDATEIDKTVKSYITQSTNIKTAFGAVVEALRSAKKALTDVESTAGGLAELVENSDQSQENKWFKNHIHNFENQVKSIAGDVKTKNQGLADKSNDLADDAFEVAVKVVGINAAVNIDSLTPLSTKALVDLTTLKTDIESNLTYSLGEKQKAQTVLNTKNQAYRTNRASFLQARLKFAGFKDVEAFIQEPNCLPDDQLATQTKDLLESISNDVEKSYQS